ncbi:hypothetical protein FBQ97_14585 [Acidobacteria bacterium ACD]|nr:hypothetical protein [Acidobacteria bacterium ACD]
MNSMHRDIAAYADTWVTDVRIYEDGQDVRPILRQALQFLSHQQLTQLPESISEQMNMLFERLRQHRCLLVLDNTESILEAGQAGQYRSGYEGYGQLVERMAWICSQEGIQADAGRAGERPDPRRLRRREGDLGDDPFPRGQELPHAEEDAQEGDEAGTAVDENLQ